MNVTHIECIDIGTSLPDEVKPDLLILNERQLRNFTAKFEKRESGCWIWTASKYPDGYGSFGLNGRMRGAHRISYEMNVGPVPDGLCVLHNCPGGDNPACINPLHLWVGTRGDNNRDREAKGRGGQVSGDQHGARLHPETVTRGDDHWMRKRPQDVLRGARNGMAKLTESEVAEIKRCYAAKEMTQVALAAKFNVRQTNISSIVLGHIWTHVK